MKIYLLLVALFFSINCTNAQGWGQTQKLTPDDRASFDEFGWSMTMDGNTIAVGAKLEDGTSTENGAVYVYEKDASNTWILTQKLRNSDTRQFDLFGQSIAMDGNYMVVGARGQDYDEFGNNFSDAAGAAYIFEKNSSGMWTEIQKIVSSDRGSTFQPVFGETVAINGDYIIVNAARESTGLSGQPNLTQAGACYIFERNASGLWVEVQKLVSSYRAANERWGDLSLAVYGNIIAVGAFRENTDAQGANELNNAGSAYIFERDTNGVWNLVEKFVPSDRDVSDGFGASVALHGTTLLISARGEYITDINSDRYGAVYVLEQDASGVWNETQKIRPSPDASDHNSRFGHSVDIEGNHMVVGAYLTNLGGDNDEGSAFIFEKDVSGTWNQTAVMYDPDANIDDFFGYDVAISGNYTAIGAYKHDEDAMGLNNISNAGAAYVFDINTPNTLPPINTLSVIENDFSAMVRAYPNPVQDMLNIEFGSHYKRIKVTVTNMLGQKVIAKNFINVNEIQLDFQDYAKGVYQVNIDNGNNLQSVLKLIRQ